MGLRQKCWGYHDCNPWTQTTVFLNSRILLDKNLLADIGGKVPVNGVQFCPKYLREKRRKLVEKNIQWINWLKKKRNCGKPFPIHANNMYIYIIYISIKHIIYLPQRNIPSHQTQILPQLLEPWLGQLPQSWQECGLKMIYLFFRSSFDAITYD